MRIRNPHVDVIAHPSGRMIQTRDDLDLDWDTVFAEAPEAALEMNGSPHRLDLSVERARRALAAGCVLTIDSDAHRPPSWTTSGGAPPRPAGHGSSPGTSSTRAAARSSSRGFREAGPGGRVSLPEVSDDAGRRRACRAA